MNNNYEKLKDLARQIRQEIIVMINNAGSGHPASALGLTEIFCALYFQIMRHQSKNPDWPQRDRLVLSAGHICAVQYVTMAYAGYFPLTELKTFRKISSRLQGHPHNLSLPGIENSSGPLGQGISQAVGMALSDKLEKNNRFVYCLCSDGEMNEGQFWEALMSANKYQLNNLIIIIDRNHIQIDGRTEDIMPLEPVDKKLRSFVDLVIEINGHDFAEIFNAVKIAQKNSHGPTVILARTVPGKGVSFMENDPVWHGKAPSIKQAKRALKQLKTKRVVGLPF